MVIQSLIAGAPLIILFTLNPQPDAEKLAPSSLSREQHGGIWIGGVFFRNSAIGPINSVFLGTVRPYGLSLTSTVGGATSWAGFSSCREPELRATFLHLVTAAGMTCSAAAANSKG
jgi:hypothetical protein